VTERTLPAPSAERRAPPGAAPPRPARRTLFARARRLVGSYGVAVVLLLVLFVLTLAGTFAQAHTSLYDVQRRYFDSLVAFVDVGPLSVPLPGGALTLALLGANLIVGGVVRLRRGWATAGILVAHLGILLLFAGGLVEFLASDKGQMTLVEPHPTGEPRPESESSRFYSYYEWELAVSERRPDGSAVEHVIPWSVLEDLEGKTLAATSRDLPVEIRVTGWSRNAKPRPTTARGEGVGGWEIDALAPAMTAERNVPAAIVTLSPPGGASGPRGIVWGHQRFPWSTSVAGRTFEVDLRHRAFEVPFTLRLDRFEMETHPGTSMAKRYSSYVTKKEGGSERRIHVTMNEPLRHRGYTFFQSGWGPEGRPGEPRWSTFSVVRNPSARVPFVACLVIAAGLLFHFGRKLSRHLSAAYASRARARAVA
jgi:hypothetical protein